LANKSAIAVMTAPAQALSALAIRQKPLDGEVNSGEPCWIRTSDLLIKSQLLYQLS
jgi:hypothetical protein